VPAWGLSAEQNQHRTANPQSRQTPFTFPPMSAASPRRDFPRYGPGHGRPSSAWQFHRHSLSGRRHSPAPHHHGRPL